MSNIPLEAIINETFSNQLCIGIVNQNTKRQCSRKGKKEFGNLCGLHNNKQRKHGIIDTIVSTTKKSTKSFVKKKNNSILINNICSNINENNVDNSQTLCDFHIIYQGLTELLLNIQTNFVYKEVFDDLIEVGKYDINNNTIYNMQY